MRELSHKPMKPKSRGANGKNGSKWIWPRTRARIYARDGFACFWCKKAAEKLSLDHVHGREHGNSPANLVTACVSCNSRRRATPARAWARACGVPWRAVTAQLRAELP